MTALFNVADYVYYAGSISICTYYLIQNSQAVKKECGPEKGYGEKIYEFQDGGQEMAVVKILITTIQVNFVPRLSSTKFT